MEAQPKTIIVTGASQGIGRALCKRLVEEGHTVIGIARSKEKLEATATELPSSLFHYEACDVSQVDQIKTLSEKIKPDVIVCAAAIAEEDANPSYNPTIVRRTIETNFFGTMNFVDAFLPFFLNKNTGHFIALSSIASWKPNKRSVSYGASKAAIALAFRGLDMKYRPRGVHFSTVYLGPVNTSMWEGKKTWILAEPEAIAAKIARLISRPKTTSFIPFLSTTLSRLSLLIPDTIYARLSSYLFK